ncbi:MAG: hypothetical protein ACTSO9_11180 [Candidatus Helarchaeota archaeon]
MPEVSYESEVRILFDDIKPFLEKIQSLNARIIKNYSFRDHIYKPEAIKNWELEQKVMRIREWPDKSQLLYTKTRIIKMGDLKFKRTYFPQGKILLYEGTLQEAQTILNDWNFKFWFLINKEEGTLYEIKNPFHITFVVEKIKDLGYTAEIEVWGENKDEIYDNFKKIIEVLEINKKRITYKSLPKIYQEKLVK